MSAPLRIFHPGDEPALFAREAIFMSASVPYRRPDPLTSEERQRNDRFLATSHAARVREAVIYVCRFALQRGLGIVFGAHPAISPMVLEVARRLSPPEGQPAPRVVIFQSAFFEHSLTRETLDLASWGSNRLLWTEAMPKGQPDRQRSLNLMRDVMCGSPNLIGGIFIGGMEGVLQESDLFAGHQRSAPRYAIGSTGSAASELLSQAPLQHCGRAVNPRLLAQSQSYALIAQRICEDLGRP
jgi:SLOG cluster3 family